MFVEDYALTLYNNHAWWRNSDSEYHVTSLLEAYNNFVRETVEKGRRPGYYSSEDLILKRGQEEYLSISIDRQDMGFEQILIKVATMKDEYPRRASRREDPIHTSDFPQAVTSFMQQTIKEHLNTLGTSKVEWSIDKPLAIKLGVYKYLKQISGEFDMDTQKKYKHLKDEAHAFAVKSLRKLKSHDLSEQVELFIADHITPLADDGNENLAQFMKDLTRRVKKLGKTHSKEAASQFLTYLENCPDQYTDYRL